MSTTSLETIWQQKSPETQKHLGREYRRMLLGALVVAEQFRDEGREMRDIIHHLDRLERWMVATFAPLAGPVIKKLSDDVERNIGQLIMGEKGKAIGDILGIAASSRSQIVQTIIDHSSYPLVTKLPDGVKARHIDGVLLPPNGDLNIGLDGEKKPFEKPGVVPRLEIFLALLKDEGVDMSEVEVIESEAPEKSFRYLPYWCIQIPGIQKQVLICEQEKQGTYVIHGALPLHELFILSKDELLKMDSPKVEMVTYWSHRSWKTKMSQVLFEDEKLKKMRELIKEEIRKKYTVQQWIDMTNAEKRLLDIGGKKYTRVASDLGVSHPRASMNEEMHLELAAGIYEEENPILKPHFEKMRARINKDQELGEDVEAWRKEIKKTYTADQWLALSPDEKLKFDFFGKSLLVLARLFGLKNVNGYALMPERLRKDFLELSIAIFDDISEEKRSEIALEIEKIEQTARLKNDPEALIRSLKELITSAEWAMMKYDDYTKIHVGKLGIDSIGSMFDIEKISQGKRKGFIQLGECVYGAGDEHIKKEMEELEILEDPEKLRAELRKRYTAEQWVALSLKEKRAMRIGGLGLEGIGNILGHRGFPSSYMKDHLKIGELVFDGEDVEKYMRVMLNDFAKQEELGNDLQKWRQEIKKQYTRDEWASIRGMRRRDVVIVGKRMTSLGSMFNIQGNPLSSKEAFEELTEAIFDQ